MASTDIEIDKPQRGRPKRAELLGYKYNTVLHSISIERASYIYNFVGNKLQ